MNDVDFDRPIDRRGTASLKWEKYANRDIIPMWVADMDFCPTGSDPRCLEKADRSRHPGLYPTAGHPCRNGCRYAAAAIVPGPFSRNGSCGSRGW